jgi:catechol 2,3-dioxygenase-like lactoylglutathione lyase family enzyme
MPDMKLEVVPLGVSDVDRAKDWYTNKAGFNLDHDVRPAPGIRVIQFTPPGSACSIVFGDGMGGISELKPGSITGLHLVVKDMDEARNALIDRGVEMGEIMDMGGIRYSFFSDPDGNGWELQEWPESYRAK